MDPIMLGIVLVLSSLLFLVVCLGGVRLFLWYLRRHHPHQLGWSDSCTAERAQKDEKAIDKASRLV